MKRSGIIITILVMFNLLSSCSQEESVQELKLPPTSVLSIQSSWAVVESTHLRLRENPDTESRASATLWRGSVLEVLTKTGSKEEVENELDYWYQINFQGLTGWVFGAYLEVFSSRERAEAVAREMK